MTTEFSDKNMIFLLSQPRAGSTLLQRILAGHPAVHTTAEPWLMLHPVYALRRNGFTAEYNATTAANALEDFLPTLPGGRWNYEEGIRHFAFYLYGTACQAAGKHYFLDKTPRYYFIIPELARIFPEATFVILLRNPLAVLDSILNTWVQGDWLRLDRHRHDLLTAPQKLIDGIDCLKERAAVVRYEALVQDPERVVEEVCGRMGLHYQPAMLEYGERPPPAGRMGDPAGVRQHGRPTTASLERWREMGQRRQTRHLALAYLEALGPPLITRMGYDAEVLRGGVTAEQCQGRGIVAPWRLVMPPRPNRLTRLALVAYELAQKRQVGHSGRHFARVLMGKG